MNIPAFQWRQLLRANLTAGILTLLMVIGMMIVIANAESRPSPYIRRADAIGDYTPAEMQRELTRLGVMVDANSLRLQELNDNMKISQGVVLGIGSVVAILQILQALGFRRRVDSGK